MDRIQSADNLLFCPDCGRENISDARFCNHCGAKLDAGNHVAKPGKASDPLLNQSLDGRFKVLRLLGEGGMGRVYLAEQTSMGRPVALKVLSPELGSDDRLKDRFRNEASLACRLNHPGTVVIYDFGVTAEGLMFIAMELLEGKSLKDELDTCGRLDWRRTSSIIRQICGSLQDAHDKSIIHRDLKPENIMLVSRHSEKDLVKVLDFGVAKILVDNDWRARRGLTAPNEIFGTPEYMSPEQARGDDMSPATDVYSLGVMMFKMLSGRLPFDAPSPIAILAKHLGEAPPKLGKFIFDTDIPYDFEALVMECLAKKVEDRPRSMDEVRRRLDDVTAPSSVRSIGAPPLFKSGRDQPKTAVPAKIAPLIDEDRPSSADSVGPPSVVCESSYFSSEPLADTKDSHVAQTPRKVPNPSGKQQSAVGNRQPDAPPAPKFAEFATVAPNTLKSPKQQTLDKLLVRIKSRRDFPAVSQNISELNSRVGLEKTSASQLANVILKDTSLTTRLIKLANSTFYGNMRGKITMVSRAVVLMGFEAVREAALGLLLFDQLQSADPNRASEMQDAAISALMAGIIAKENAWRIDGINKEEAFICAMFHNLGRQAAIYYLPNQMKEIRALTESGTSEDLAALEVLGVSYDDLGQELAKQWDFPEQIRKTMLKLPAGALDRPKLKEEKLRYLAGFAVELTRLAAVGDAVEGKALFEALAERFGEGMKVRPEELSDLVSDSLLKMEEYAKHMNLRPAKSVLVQQIHHTLGVANEMVSDESDQSTRLTHSGKVIRTPNMSDDEYAALVREIEAEELGRREQILKEGIDEVAASLKGRFDLNTVMLMVLESMFRALQFRRVFFCLYDVRTKTLRARFGFGDDVDEILPSFFFPVKGGRDIFVSAMSGGEDVVIPDTTDRKITSQIPQWYRNLVNAPMVFLYPIRIKQFPAAMFYGDMAEAHREIEPSLLEQMRVLRGHAASAIAMVERDRATRR
jgi:serine/threonine protein kinase